jgi:hypothetical protein
VHNRESIKNIVHPKVTAQSDHNLTHKLLIEENTFYLSQLPSVLKQESAVKPSRNISLPGQLKPLSFIQSSNIGLSN